MASNSGPSAVYVLDIKGKPLISRDYRGDVEASAIDKFFPLVMDAEEEEGMTCPIIRCDDCTFMYVKYGNVYLVCAATRNANVMLIFVFLHKLIEVFKEYFKELEEESIRDNFVIIYELLDELMDFGYPQTTDPKILQLYITQQGRKLESAAPKPPMALTNAVSWRNEGIKHRKNEVFLDVVEKVLYPIAANVRTVGWCSLCHPSATDARTSFRE
eukprot:m.348634 g.348634  ORF g.348634 m.348634 type:complete len:215 (-) comp20678_c0_seq6:196-840(-)